MTFHHQAQTPYDGLISVCCTEVQRCDILHKDVWVIQNIASDGELLLKTGDFLENYLEADKR